MEKHAKYRASKNPREHDQADCDETHRLSLPAECIRLCELYPIRKRTTLRQRVFVEKLSLVTQNGSVEPVPTSSFLLIVRQRLEPVGVLLCLHALAARAVEAHQGFKHITIVWMICEIFFQSCDRCV
jgi:hypothetical protein